MGYDLHITRAKFHYQNQGAWITADEWLQYIEQDPELTLAGYNGDYFALWSGKSGYPDPWLDWFEGNIYTKNPDDPLINKMVDIAKKLSAQAQGDDGEIYTGGGQSSSSPRPNLMRQPLARGNRGFEGYLVARHNYADKRAC
jgi:hypothetical protein